MLDVVMPKSAGIPNTPAGPTRLLHPAGLRRHRRWLRFSLPQTRIGFIAACFFVGFLLVASLVPSWLAPGDPLAANARAAFRAPSIVHPFGTDENGRDLYTRVIHGVRPSVLMGVAATAVGLGLGVAVGLIAGLGHRLIDNGLMRAIDVLLAFPDILLALVIITFWGQGTLNAIIAVGMASVPRYARLVRAQTQVVRRALYVESALTLGLHPLTLVWRHVLPNAIKPVLLLATIGIGGKIAAGASLSFLGLGTPPPAPEWGAMLSVGRNFLANAWWLTAVPGIAVTLTVLAVTAVGRELTRRSEGRTTP